MDGIATIGVYGWSLDEWLDALGGAGVTDVWDVRDRRGVRGAAGRWANGNVLEGHLAEVGLGYRHLRALAPPTPLRNRLQEDDRAHGRRHRDREALPDWFAAEYADAVLVDLGDALTDVGLDVVGRPALLCVEGPASACHRSLAAAALAERTGAPVTHLTPDRTGENPAV